MKLSNSDLEPETNRIPDSVVSLKGADMDGRRLSLTSANTTGNYLELYGKSAVWTEGHVSSISKNEGAGQTFHGWVDKIINTSDEDLPNLYKE